MKNDKRILLALTSAILAALSPAAWAGGPAPETASGIGQATAAPAQQAAPQNQQPHSQSTTRTLQAIVVTGSPIGVKKLDASYNIVTANREEIRQTNP